MSDTAVRGGWLCGSGCHPGSKVGSAGPCLCFPEFEDSFSLTIAFPRVSPATGSSAGEATLPDTATAGKTSEEGEACNVGVLATPRSTASGGSPLSLGSGSSQRGWLAPLCSVDSHNQHTCLKMQPWRVQPVLL